MNKFNIIDSLLVRHANKRKVAIIDGGKNITYSTLLSYVIALPHKIKKLEEMKKGSIVTLLFDDSIESSICFSSLIYYGLIPCYLNPYLPITAYNFYLKSVSTKLILISSEHLNKFQNYFDLNEIEYAVISTDLFKEKQTDNFKNCESFSSQLTSPLFCSYTSGTTGHPSAVMHQHKDVKIMNENYVSHILSINEDDVIFSTSKMYFAYGLNNLLISLYYGAMAILSPRNLSSENIWNLINKYNPSVFFSVPMVYRKLLDEQYIPKNIQMPRICISAGEKLPETIFDSWRKFFNGSIIDGIGSTETLSTFISNKPTDIKKGSTGKLVNGFLGVIKGKDGRILSPNNVGVLWIKGNTYPNSYINNQLASNERFIDGWFVTNDMFYQDEEGNFYYQGRVNDLIYNRGSWIFPSRIEKRLNEHEDIFESVVIGKRTENGDTLIINFVVLKNNVNLNNLKREIDFFNKKDPYYREEENIHVIHVVDDLPKTVTGKIKRHELINSDLSSEAVLLFKKYKKLLIFDSSTL